MNAMKLFAIFLAMILVPFSALASCPTQKTALYFGNGMDRTEQEAEESRWAIERLLSRQPFYRSECLSVKLAYNRTEGLNRDILEAARQKEIEEDLTPTNFWEMFTRLTAPRPWFLNLMASAFLSVDRPNPTDPKILAQIEEHLEAYRSEPTDTIIGILGHSQGTLFGNEAYLAMTMEERARTRLIAIATPAAYVADGGPYETIEEDAIITNTFIGELEPNIPAPNRDDGTFCPDDWFCHGIETSYLYPDTASRVRILADVKRILPTIPTHPHITVDGDPSEWNGIPAIITDPDGDDAFSDVVSVKITNDAEFVYFLVTFARQPTAEHVLLYLNTDGDHSTGCFRGNGSEYGIVLRKPGSTAPRFIADARDCELRMFDLPGSEIDTSVERENIIEIAVPISTFRVLTPEFAGFEVTVTEPDATNTGAYTLR